MTPRAWFTVALRIMGVWQVLLGVEAAATVFTVSRGLSHPLRTELGAYFTITVVHFLAALLLLTGAPAIASIFYPRTAQSASDTSIETAE
jgi:hypothetical protein